MTYKIVAQEEITQSLKLPFNPPVITDSFSEEDFRAEYWRVHGLVAERLRLLGEEDDYGEGDFVMSQDFGLSRFIGIELSSKKMWSKELLSVLNATLKEVSQAYRIYIDHDLDEEPLFFILVQRDDVIGHCEDRTLLRKFNFPV
jgi:hypothetical protein